MREYYVVYDMSPKEQGEDYIQVGIAYQNGDKIFGAEHYLSQTAEEEKTKDNLKERFVGKDTSRHSSYVEPGSEQVDDV